MKASEALRKGLYHHAHWEMNRNGERKVTLRCNRRTATIKFKGDIFRDADIIVDDDLPYDWGKRLKEAREQRLTGEK